MKILISACLLGYNCKYNGGNNYNEKIVNCCDHFEFIPICPEVFGGLSTPRKPSEQIADKVLTKDNDDFTMNFAKGAKISLATALNNNCKYAILKAKSPSCGYGKIYDGTFSGVIVDGNGVAAELLFKNGIEIYNENNFCELLEKVKNEKIIS